MQCHREGCPFRVIKSDAGWRHVDTHGTDPGHSADPDAPVPQRFSVLRDQPTMHVDLPAEDWLAPIRARANAATPGPWTHYSQGFLSPKGPEPLGEFIVAPYHELDISAEDAEFIAGTREDVPRLLDEIDRLRQAVQRVRDLVGEDYQQSGREVSCGGYLVTDDGCFASSLARRITAALDGQVAP